ncbi:MAG: hypothetical protein ACKOQM_07635 [Novosphingobium sp.]
MKLNYVLMTALLAGSPAMAKPVKRAAPVAVKVDPDARKAAADRLAEVLTPQNAMPAQVDKILASLLENMKRNDPSFERMEQTYPGMLQAVGDAMRPVLLKSSMSTVPLYRADLSQLFQGELTAAEADAASRFFGSNDGQALIASLQDNMQYNRSVGAVAADKTATNADVRADKGAAGVRTFQSLEPAQRQRVMAFFTSPAGRKLIALGPKRTAIDQKWFNYSPPGSEKEIQTAVLEAMVQHIAKTDPEKSAKFRAVLEGQGLLAKKPN